MVPRPEQSLGTFFPIRKGVVRRPVLLLAAIVGHWVVLRLAGEI